MIPIRFRAGPDGPLAGVGVGVEVWFGVGAGVMVEAPVGDLGVKDRSKVGLWQPAERMRKPGIKILDRMAKIFILDLP